MSPHLLSAMGRCQISNLGAGYWSIYFGSNMATEAIRTGLILADQPI